MDGWASLGAMLAGGGGAGQAGYRQGVQMASAMADARRKRDAEMARAAFAQRAEAAGDADLADYFMAGVDPRQLSGYRKDQQAIGWGDEAWGNATGEAPDLELLNRMNLVRTGKPVDLTSIQDHTAFNPMALPESQELATNEIGQAMIAKERAHAGAFGAQANAANALAGQRNRAGSGDDLVGAMGGGKASDYQIVQAADGTQIRVNKLTGEAAPIMLGEGAVIGPNSYKAQKASMAAGSASGQLANSTAQLDRLGGIAQQLLDGDEGLERITGLYGRFPSIPGGAAADAEAKLETLKSQVGFAVLQQMRDMSKTGGALGQVSDRENILLQNNLESLQQSQSTEQIRRSLQALVDYANSAKARLQGAYDQTYGGASNEIGSAMGMGGGNSRGYALGEVVTIDGQQYRVVGGDPSDPDLEPL